MSAHGASLIENTLKYRMSSVPVSSPPRLNEKDSRDWDILLASPVIVVGFAATFSVIVITSIHPARPPFFE
jgi:hypothetical protein